MTQVGVKRPKDIHTATHPAAKLERREHEQRDDEPGVDRADVIAALDEEADDGEGGDEG